MTCDQLQDSHELYALGCLDEPEQSELRGHLERGCPNCMPRFRQALQVNSLLMASIPLVEPPKRLRQRILAMIQPSRSQASIWAWLWAAAATALLGVAVYTGYDSRRQAAGEFRQMQARLEQVNQILAFLNEPETKTVTFGSQTPVPRGRVFLHPRRGVILFASNLPLAAPGRIYEMWLIPKAGKPLPAGLFQVDRNGSAMHVLNGTVDLSGLGAVAVTVEPEAGSPAPTSTPLFVAGVESGF